MKSSVDDIRRRFDRDVERFSNLETGQTTTIDAPLMMALAIQAALAATPQAAHLLDVGCGAGNYSLKLLEAQPNTEITLVDLSRPMLDRAVERIRAVSNGAIHTRQGDIRELDFEPGQFDIIFAAAVLHHLRGVEEWEAVFNKFYVSLKPGGSMWVVDLVSHANPDVQAMMWERYGRYLTALKDEAYRDHVFDYIEMEDTPRPLTYQLDLLGAVGFEEITVLHKVSCFAAFGGKKPDQVTSR
jgi:tRNA (cmo5U34)-methyltransferase